MYLAPYLYEQIYLVLNYKNIDEKMYTNASKGQERVGMTFIWKNIVNKFKLPNSYSIFTAEAFAIHLIHEYSI
jgi:hypothetical protein